MEVKSEPLLYHWITAEHFWLLTCTVTTVRAKLKTKLRTSLQDSFPIVSLLSAALKLVRKDYTHIPFSNDSLIAFEVL